MADRTDDLLPRKKIVTWILVADGARARVLANEGPGKGLYDALDQDFVGVNLLMRESVSDKAGRGQESATTGRHAVEPRTDWQRFEKNQFAKRMAEILDDAAQRKAFDRLILIAPPQALGDLRAALGRHAKDKVTAELDKDLTHVAIHELPGHLADILVV